MTFSSTPAYSDVTFIVYSRRNSDKFRFRQKLNFEHMVEADANVFSLDKKISTEISWIGLVL